MKNNYQEIPWKRGKCLYNSLHKEGLSCPNICSWYIPSMDDQWLKVFKLTVSKSESNLISYNLLLIDRISINID